MFIDVPHKLSFLLYWPELDHVTNSGGQDSEDGSIFDEARFYHKVRAPLVRKKGKKSIYVEQLAVPTSRWVVFT